MGLSKPQLRAKFEVAGFISYRNIRKFVSKRQIRFLSHSLGVRGNVRTSSIARWKARIVDFLFAIIELFSLALTVDALIRRNRLCRRGGPLWG